MLAVLFVLAPLYYHPNLGGQGLHIPNNGTIWLVAVLFIAYGLYQSLKSKKAAIPKYFIYLAAFPILITAGSFISGVDDSLIWGFHFLFIMGGLAFFFSLFQVGLTSAKVDRLLLVIAISGFFHAVMAMLQLTVNADLPIWLPKTTNNSPSGFLQQINTQATLLVTLIVLIFYLASRPILFRRKRLVQGLLVTTVLMAGFIIGESDSRIGWLSLFISLPMLLVSRRFILKNNNGFTLALLMSLATGFLIPQFNYSFDNAVISRSPTVVEKVTAMNSGFEGSSRLSIYGVSFDLLKEKPFLGYGMGSFGREFQNAKPKFFEKYPDAKVSNRYVAHPHNEFLLWWVEGGVIAIVGIVSVLVGTLLVLTKLGGARAWGYSALLLPIVLHMQVELPLYISSLHWFLLLFFLALPFRHNLTFKNNSLSVSTQRLAIFSTFSLTCVALLFLAHTIRANWDFYKVSQSAGPMTYASKNPYFSLDTQKANIAALLYNSMEMGNKPNVIYVADWAEHYALSRPDKFSFFIRLEAYDYLGQKTEFCRVATRGSSIYPQDNKLHKAKVSCS